MDFRNPQAFPEDRCGHINTGNDGPTENSLILAPLRPLADSLESSTGSGQKHIAKGRLSPTG